MKLKSTIGGLQFSGSGTEWTRGSVRVFRHIVNGAPGRWVAVAPGMSASGVSANSALERLKSRVREVQKWL